MTQRRDSAVLLPPADSSNQRRLPSVHEFVTYGPFVSGVLRVPPDFLLKENAVVVLFVGRLSGQALLLTGLIPLGKVLQDWAARVVITMAVLGK